MFNAPTLGTVSKHFHSFRHPESYQEFDHDTFQLLPEKSPVWTTPTICRKAWSSTIAMVWAICRTSMRIMKAARSMRWSGSSSQSMPPSNDTSPVAYQRIRWCRQRLTTAVLPAKAFLPSTCSPCNFRCTQHLPKWLYLSTRPIDQRRNRLSLPRSSWLTRRRRSPPLTRLLVLAQLRPRSVSVRGADWPDCRAGSLPESNPSPW